VADLNNFVSSLDVKNKNKSIDTDNRGRKRRTWLENNSVEEVCLMEPDEIKNWDFHDRPNNELGDLVGFADELKRVGQQQPCIVRPTEIGSKKKYELIVGERRWRAAKLGNIKLKVIIKEVDDKLAAIMQSAENSNREDLSDYAKGMNYAKLIENNILLPKDIVDELGVSKQQLSRILSFSKIPDKVCSAIDDFSKVSTRTASEILRICNKGDEFQRVLIKYAGKIREAKLGSEKLYKLVCDEINSHQNLVDKGDTRKSFSKKGKHLFTIKKNKNKESFIHFSPDISRVINDGSINIEDIERCIQELLEPVSDQ